MKTVCCVMLANGREAMVRRAVQSFQAQTYQAKSLLIYDNTPEYGAASKGLDNGADVHVHANPTAGLSGRTIGVLRNAANDLASRGHCDIILHFDSDDWSHPNRIAEQVALLEATKKQAVGYRDMLFWRTPVMREVRRERAIYEGEQLGTMTEYAADGEAWLYTNPNERYCLGTSLCYWREVWASKPFPDLPNARGSTGEDTQWLQGLDSMGVTSIVSQDLAHQPPWQVQIEMKEQPRMIAAIHGGNTMPYDEHTLSAPNFKRVPEWDAHCSAIMRL